MQTAELWQKVAGAAVQCRLCSHYCVIPSGSKGRCGVRQNNDGTLYTHVRDKVAAANLDPVEKKPLFHFLPGTKTFSFGTMGCNFSCSFCQNHTLSTPPRLGLPVQGQIIAPEQIVQEALDYGAKSISYTYSEPTIFFELMKATAECAHKNGLKNIMVSNGYQSPECLSELDGLIDACNIDLKAFSDSFYKDLCGAKRKPVLSTIKAIKKFGWWLELTTLLVTDKNDSDAEILRMAEFILHDVGKDTPWHISRFHPMFQLNNLPPTPLDRLERAWEIGQQVGLQYVYIGNVHNHQSEHTRCAACSAIVIPRSGYSVPKTISPTCEHCGQILPGVWKE